jgi:hypothetical protein
MTKTTDLPLDLGLVAAIAVVLAIPIISRVARRQFDPFEPIVVFACAYGVMFVARPASMLASNHLAYDGPQRSTGVSGTFSEMLVLALLGALGFVVGYELSLGPRLAKRLRAPHHHDVRRLVVAALAAAGLAIVSFLVFLGSSPNEFSTLNLILRGRSTELSQMIANTSFYVWFSFLLLVPAVLVLVAVGLDRGNKRFLLAALPLAALFLFRTVPLGDRTVLLAFVGGLVVLYYVTRGTRPSLTAILALLAVALVGSAFLSDLRGRGTRNESVSQTIVRSLHPDRIASPFTSGPDSEMAPVFAAALTVIPERLPHTYGSTIFGDLVARPIPRALWSDKPEPPRDALITRLWPVEGKDRIINPEFSVLLYFYWDFGAPGIVIGLLLYGIGARLLFEYFKRYRFSVGAQVSYSLALWFIVIGLRDSPVDTLVLATFIVFPAWLVFRLAPDREMRALVPASQ